ncbi:MAG: hypothetical protein JXO72_14920 [Vicinamibacteria bacterium]|nr:hypothetical protein [Vicinamibacteria bacterium]
MSKRDALDVLVSEMTASPVLASEVFSRADAAGLLGKGKADSRWRRLRRAADRLGVPAMRRGYPARVAWGPYVRAASGLASNAGVITPDIPTNLVEADEVSGLTEPAPMPSPDTVGEMFGDSPGESGDTASGDVPFEADTGVENVSGNPGDTPRNPDGTPREPGSDDDEPTPSYPGDAEVARIKALLERAPWTARLPLGHERRDAA